MFCCFILQLLVKDSKDGTIPYGKISQSQFEELMSLYSIRSRVEPGDAVGILAAQVCGSVMKCAVTNKILSMAKI